MEVRRKKEIGYLLLRDHLAHGNRLNANIGFILLLLNVLVLSDIYKKKRTAVTKTKPVCKYYQQYFHVLKMYFDSKGQSWTKTKFRWLSGQLFEITKPGLDLKKQIRQKLSLVNL